MKKFLKVAILMTLTGTLLVGCGGPGDQKAGAGKDTTIKIGHVEPENRSTHQALVHFKETVEKDTKGSVKVEIYPNGALGGDVQLTEAVATGSLDAALPSTSVLTAYADDFGVLDMPYLFTSSEAAFNAMDGEVGDYFTKKLAEKGLVNLGYTYNGPRSTTTNVRPIVKPADLQGIKMRVMESPIFIDYYKTLGANPTPMSFTEVYTGLQQGTVDAEENPPSLILANKFFEVQKYLSLDEHTHNFLAFIMNKGKFDSLSKEQQDALVKAAKAYVKEQRDMELKDNGEAIKKLQEAGMQVNSLTAEEKAAFRTALSSMYDTYRNKFGNDIFAKAEKYNK